MSTPPGPLYLGLDLSTQQLKAIVVDSDLKTVAQAKVEFDDDLGSKYGIRKGVHVRDATGEVVAPVAMWLEALDLVLARLRAASPSPDVVACLAGLDAARPLVDQLPAALAHEWSPNWQDQSTQAECDAFDTALGGRQKLAEVTGSGAHHRFTGAQIMRLRRVLPDMYANTVRISLVSSWLASVLLGALAPLDVSDVCGMNLWDMPAQRYSHELLALAAGGRDGAEELRAKLGEPVMDGGASLGLVSPYFVARYGFSPDCRVVPFTGDNPATMLALPLRPLDAIVSLGTSTTFLMNTSAYRPDGSYHFFNHPTTAGHYMFMLCYKNGGLARERVRDDLPRDAADAGTQQKQQHQGGEWDAFNQAVMETPPLDMAEPGGRAKMGLYFCLRETVPNIRAGTWRFTCNPDGSALAPAADAWPRATDARIITESQALELCPSRGGPGAPGEWRGQGLAGGGSACALGGAYKALWACERAPGQTLDDLVAARWREESAVKRVGEGFRPETYRAYGRVLGAFEEMEQMLLAEEKHV
ncbi:xylulokinase [Ophiocordyceps sinensis CO18]|uniref:Xylulose kinase n=1 Tax=Ophiocordyceps sinensis (strain Co18 / CGMCC 3.14243) TaxID=911162 RepID=T5A107_OPHSC|nr:xylulokinase [Ophiocordyceps sinensis CO18]